MKKAGDDAADYIERQIWNVTKRIFSARAKQPQKGAVPEYMCDTDMQKQICDEVDQAW